MFRSPSRYTFSGLAFSRHARVRPVVASLSLFAFLGGQVMLPALFTWQTVSADVRSTEQRKQAVTAQEEARKPKWVKMMEARLAREKKQREARLAEGEAPKGSSGNFRLTQGNGEKGGPGAFKKPGLIPVPGSKPGQVVPSAPLDCEDCEVDVRALNLSKVPTERDLRRAGQLGGALTPSRPAEPEEVRDRLDKVLKRLGMRAGLNDPTPENKPVGQWVKRAQRKAQRAQEINLDFGQAIQEWNKHNYSKAARMFEKHVKDYPESPWVGEARMHLGCDAKYNGRFAEAQEHYNAILETSRRTPLTKEEKEKRREEKEAGKGRDRALDRVMAKAKDPVEAIDGVEDQTDFTFDLHQKAKARWADLDIATGRWNEAAKKLQDLIASDTDWRRKTWAHSWLTTLSSLGPQATRMAACGPKALERVLVQLDKPDAARQAGAIVPKTLAGLSLAELQGVSKRSGTPMMAFVVADEPSAKMARLADLPLPAIVHTETARGFDEKTSFFADRALKRAPLVAIHPDAKKPGVLPANVVRLMAKDKGGLAQPLGQELFKSGLTTSGHYLVLESVNTKTRQAKLFDPSANRFYHLSFAQLSEQWSGKGLALQGRGAAQFQLASLSSAESEKTRGGCCGSFEPPVGTGPEPDNQPVCPDGGCDEAPYGEPKVSINRTNLNVYARDIPLWYKPGKGPAVELDMSYNSQDGLSQRNPFGNKWMFNYGMYVVEDTQAGGGQVLGIMGDGSVDRYYPTDNGGFTTQSDNLNTLRKLSSTRYELEFPGGSVALFDIPAGTTSLQPFLIELRDAWGLKLSFGYNSQVQLTTITDALGQVSRFKYDAAGKVTSVWDPFGRHAAFSYDGDGNLVECVDMEGHAFQYTYDSFRDAGVEYRQDGISSSVYLTRLQSAQGAHLFSHSYGFPNRILTVTDPLGQSETFRSDWWGPSNYSYTDKNGVSNGYSVETTSTYKSRVSQERQADGTQINKIIDPNTGLVTSLSDERGKVTNVTYNARQQVTSTRDPKGNTSTLTYAANGLDVTRVTNANGVQVMSATYNARHQPLSVTDEDGTTTTTYTAWGAPASSTDPAGRVTQFNYNALGQLVSTNYNGATLGSQTYDAIGRVQSQTDALGLTIGYEYNNLDAVTKVSYPDGTSEETDYTCCRLPGVVKDRAGRKTYFDYDPLRRLVRVQDAQGNTLEMGYDRENRRTRLLDAKGRSTRWSYDALGRVTQKTYHDGTSEGFSYAQGLLAQSRGARGQIVSYGYDDNGNVSLIDYPNMANVSFTYNKLDDVASVVDGVGTHGFTYSNTGRLLEQSGPLAGAKQSFTYDDLGRLGIHYTERGASGSVHKQLYSYDALDRLSAIESSDAGLFTYSYVGTSSLLSRLQLPNGTRADHGYDALQRLTNVQNVQNGGANLASYVYAYDTRDVRTGAQSRFGSEAVRQVNYGYDAVDQLTGESATGGSSSWNYSNTFQYDAMGNRTRGENVRDGVTTTSRGSSNALNQLTALSRSSGGVSSTNGMSYDLSGNLTQTANADGSRTLYTYDDADRLTRLETRNAAGAPVRKSEWVYDYAGRKVVTREFVWTNNGWFEENETRRVFDGMDVMQERNDGNKIVAQYTRDGNIGGILARTTEGGSVFYGYDGSGNVVLLTDEDGAEVGRYSYDAFGNTLEMSGAKAAENPFRFSTKELHAASGLYDYGYRFYSTSMGRWLNRDPIRESGGVNLYAALLNDPINNQDEYGEAVHPALIVGGIIVGVIIIRKGGFRKGGGSIFPRPRPVIGPAPRPAPAPAPVPVPRPVPAPRPAPFTGTGPRGFYRPSGVPKSWPGKPSTDGKGMRWEKPGTKGATSVRVMPGDPKSKWPTSQVPYVRMQKNGRPLDKNGNELPTKHCPDAHIPRKGFKVDPKWFD